MIPVHRGKIERGKMVLFNHQKYLVQISKLEGKEIDLTVKEHKGQRSMNQNSYYWGVVISILGDFCGYDPEEMHEALKFKFLRKGKEGLETVTSTTDLNTKEFEEYLEKIRRWGSMELNCYIPQPNEALP